jgi:Methyltransferase domain/Glycosyltransferase family 9 (heptosyltransferase)
MAFCKHGTVCGNACMTPITKSKVQVAFPHGLGDCAMFAHQIPLYTRRGVEVEIACNPDKHILFAGTGARLVEMRPDFPKFGWEHPRSGNPAPGKSLAYWNKAAWNLSTSPMPDIGSPDELWDEYCAQRIDIRPHLAEAVWRKVGLFLDHLPRPIILLHTIGNSFQRAKSLSHEVTMRLYHELLDHTEGTLVLLDWDKRVPKLNHFRVRHLTDDWDRIDVEHLLALLDRSDLIIGIDSGPLHAARYSDTPALGIFWNSEHHPVRYCLPRGRQACIVPEKVLPELSERARLDYHILTIPGDSLDAALISRHAARMLQQPRYLGRQNPAADLQLQQMVRDWSRGVGNEVSGRMDRDRGWDVILQECSRRFEHPTIVETGCIRTKKDWAGAGNSTVLLGEYALWTGGSLVSVDISEHHCDVARQETQMLPMVRVVCSDSVAFLSAFVQPIDFLYLDSMDTFVPGSPEHALKEIQAALQRSHKDSIVVFDDTAWSCGGFKGKGAHAVPWLLSRGWRILFSGYQTALVRG